MTSRDVEGSGKVLRSLTKVDSAPSHILSDFEGSEGSV